MHYLVGKAIALLYLTQCGRYDEDLKIKLDEFEHTQKLFSFGQKRLFSMDDCNFTCK